MKTSMTKVSLAVAMLAISSVATAGIANTKHNFGKTANTGNSGSGWNWTNGTTEICVFCHTPHGADDSAAAPLWNRSIGSNTYTMYSTLGTSTLDATDQQLNGSGSISLACLSCHDGTQAMDAMMNTPGGGNESVLVGFYDLPDNTGLNGWVEFQSMSEISAEIIYLGTDLSNDHPVAIQYAGAGGANVDGDFKTAVAGGGSFYLEGVGADGSTANSAGLDKGDMKLYTATGGTLIGQALVECATCHDPHSENTTFLRNTQGNENSATCLSCHTK